MLEAQDLAVAAQKLERFVDRFGESYRLLAYHAALPLLLTPELLNYLRNRFLRGQVPWVAEVDLLLSDLCDTVSHELYAMDTGVRAFLLDHPPAGVPPGRAAEVASLLIQYVQQLARTNPQLDSLMRDAQRWSALVYMGDRQRQRVAEEIVACLRDALAFPTRESAGGAGSLRESQIAFLVRITATLSPRLTGHTDLVLYAREVGQLLLDPEAAPTSSSPAQVEIEGILLPSPAEVAKLVLGARESPVEQETPSPATDEMMLTLGRMLEEQGLAYGPEVEEVLRQIVDGIYMARDEGFDARSAMRDLADSLAERLQARRQKDKLSGPLLLTLQHIPPEYQIYLRPPLADVVTKPQALGSRTGPPRNDAQTRVRIGIWGGWGAGKTTYLSALQIAALYEPGSWTIVPQEQLHPGSSEFLMDGSRTLNSGRTFPPATSNMREVSYSVSGQPSQDRLSQIRDGFFGRPSVISFQLNFLDLPGGAFVRIADPEDPLWPYLAQCQGIIYLYDPELEGTALPNVVYLLRALPMLVNATQRFAPQWLVNGRLPHYLAICLAKYDEPVVFERLLRERLVHVDALGTRPVPRVIDPKRAFDLFADTLTKRLLDRYFLPERVRFFATSSIGFYAEPEHPGQFNPRDYYNVAMTPNGPKLRGEIHPVDVFAPLVWIASQATRNPRPAARASEE